MQCFNWKYVYIFRTQAGAYDSPSSKKPFITFVIGEPCSFAVDGERKLYVTMHMTCFRFYGSVCWRFVLVISYELELSIIIDMR